MLVIYYHIAFYLKTYPDKTATIFRLFDFNIFIYVFIWVATHVCAGGHRDQERALDRLELEWQETVSCLTWVLGTQPRASAGAVFPFLYFLSMMMRVVLSHHTLAAMVDETL